MKNYKVIPLLLLLCVVLALARTPTGGSIRGVAEEDEVDTFHQFQE